ncbi:MAG: histidinol-phosphatase [Eubacterium sp.]|nr:histidinol-phosphatase [Eubacterium sp.]
MKYNLHTHTVRCFHAQGGDEEYVEYAIKNGYKLLGISDHCPYIYKDGYVSHMRMAPDEAEDYISSFRYLAGKYKNDIDIKIGFEMEWYPDLMDGQHEFLKTLDFDYLILGQHFTENEQDKNSVYTGSRTFSVKTLDKYISQLLNGARSGLFTYVCHPDLINFAGSRKVYDKKLGDMLEELKKLSLPIEYNFYGYIDSRWYPYDRFWRLAKEVGNDVVIGMDAHTPLLFDMEDERKKMIAHITDDLGITPLNEVKIIKPKF